MKHDLDLLLDQIDRAPDAAVQARHRIALFLLERLGVDDVSCWTLEPDGPHPAARRVAGCQAGSSAALPPLRLSADQCAGYFAATQRTGLLISQDALHDERLAGARAAYLEPHDIRSLLSITVSVSERPVAVVSCAQRGRHRHWSSGDVALMQQLGAGLAARHGRRHAGAAGRAGLDRCGLLALCRSASRC
jgi:GAF domain-containing protein